MSGEAPISTANLPISDTAVGETKQRTFNHGSQGCRDLVLTFLLYCLLDLEMVEELEALRKSNWPREASYQLDSQLTTKSNFDHSYSNTVDSMPLHS